VQPRWILARDIILPSNGIAWPDLCGSDCIARLLQRRQFTCADEVRAFLNPRLSTLADPFVLPGMQDAVERIFHAIDQHQRIVLFGDYDVDGVTSLALLSEMLRAYGSEAALFLPLRIEEGYGLSKEGVARCLRLHNPQLLIAIDCGTSSSVEIASLRKAGVDVLVLDHHEPPRSSGLADEPKTELPECLLVNPKTTNSGFEYLCSVGLTFKLCHALLKTRRIDFDLKTMLDLVALGTVADIVPLQGDNRVFVKTGSAVIARSHRAGMIKLIEVAGVKPPVMPDDIGYRLGPRLNAAGRLATAEKALRLLLTDNAIEATELARELDEQNRQRQEVEGQILQQAEEELAKNFDPARDAGIVLGGRGWHPGVLGIVASRISKKYYRPTIIIGFDESGAGKGSGRSVENCSIVRALTECGSALEKFGGHEMAAGVSLREENLPRFREQFLEATRRQLSNDALAPPLHLDAEVGLAEINVDLLYWHEMLQPFGNGNPQPTFVCSAVEAARPPRIVGERHLDLRLKKQNAIRRAIFFDSASVPLPPAPWDVAFRLHPNIYAGETRVDLHVQALRQAAPFN
jgi:single-stranded-DNA-specific exonuclease